MDPIAISPRLASYGFKRPFGIFTVRACELCIVIIHRVDEHSFRHSWDVYQTHGTPGGAFWRNSEPLQSFNTLELAKGFAERLYGIVGSGDLATVLN